MSGSVRTLPTPLTLDDFDVGVTLGTGSFGRVRFATHKVSFSFSVLLFVCLFSLICLFVCLLHLQTNQLILFPFSFFSFLFFSSLFFLFRQLVHFGLLKC